jgi:hypothetical protein
MGGEFMRGFEKEKELLPREHFGAQVGLLLSLGRTSTVGSGLKNFPSGIRSIAAGNRF